MGKNEGALSLMNLKELGLEELSNEQLATLSEETIRKKAHQLATPEEIAMQLKGLTLVDLGAFYTERIKQVVQAARDKLESLINKKENC